MKNKKEELQKQLDEIKKQEEKELVDKHYPEFKKFEGKCFKMRNNYSLPEVPSDYWWLYKKVVKIKKEDIYFSKCKTLKVLSYYDGYSFQTDKHGRITINKNEQGYIHGLGEEITEKEFNDAWDKMIVCLEKLKEVIDTISKKN